jgi:hypothetical protein
MAEDKRYTDPSVFTTKDGNITYITHLKIVKGLEKTTNSMSMLAYMNYRDDLMNKTGTDNYVLSMDKIMDALDAFLNEKFGRKAGMPVNYDLSKSEDATLYLLWQYRHTMNHCGATIDAKCKADSEKVMANIKAKGGVLAIPMPESPEIGKTMTFTQKEYLLVRNCLFKFIGRHIPKEELEILVIRSRIAKMETNTMTFGKQYGKEIISFTLKEADSIGLHPLWDKTIGVTIPEPFRYDPESSTIINDTTGKSIKVQRKPVPK